MPSALVSRELDHRPLARLRSVPAAVRRFLDAGDRDCRRHRRRVRGISAVSTSGVL